MHVLISLVYGSPVIYPDLRSVPEPNDNPMPCVALQADSALYISQMRSAAIYNS